MQEMCARAIRAVGSKVYFAPGEEQSAFWASVQPVLQLPEQTSNPLGYGLRHRYELYAPWDSVARRMVEGDLLWHGVRRYVVRRVETIQVGAQPVYRWAALELAPRGEEG